ncbi:hypothetical protein SB773_32230, partial [Bacillus sp. SIMBA_074]|uniref:hypothetical protein n=1 Tax=Bacillus sp. SIMBA_074 TaxID=3085812 RepID=UPI00397A00AC
SMLTKNREQAVKQMIKNFFMDERLLLLFLPFLIKDLQNHKNLKGLPYGECFQYGRFLIHYYLLQILQFYVIFFGLPTKGFVAER